MRGFKSFPERPLAQPGRMPSDMDGDTVWYSQCSKCGDRLSPSERESPVCRDCAPEDLFSSDEADQ